METSNPLKVVPFVVISLISCFLVARSIPIIFTDPSIILNYKDLLSTLLVFSVFLVIFVTSTILFQLIEANTKINLVYALLISVAYTFGYVTVGIYNPILFVVNLIFIAFGVYYMRTRALARYKNSIKPSLADIFSSGARGFLLILAILLSLSFFILFSDGEKKAELEQELVDAATNITTPLVSKSTVDQLNTQINDVLDSYGNLPVSNLQPILDQINSQLGLRLSTKNIVEQGNQEVKLNITHEELKPTVRKSIKDMIGPYTDYIIMFFVITYYLTFTALFTITSLMVLLFGSLLTKILRLSKYMTEEKQQVEVTRYKV